MAFSNHTNNTPNYINFCYVYDYGHENCSTSVTLTFIVMITIFATRIADMPGITSVIINNSVYVDTPA